MKVLRENAIILIIKFSGYNGNPTPQSSIFKVRGGDVITSFILSTCVAHHTNRHKQRIKRSPVQYYRRLIFLFVPASAVRSTCQSDSQCTENAECRILANSTTTSKMCLCKEEFTEREGWCSSK